MKKDVKDDILSILKDSYRAIESNDIVKLKEASDHTLHCMSIYQDGDSSSIAIIIYSLAKIFEKEEYRVKKEWSEFYRKVLRHIGEARELLGSDNLTGYNSCIKELLKLIHGLEKKFGLYVDEVLQSAKIKKGSKIYSHGISSGRVAEMLGISEWELMSYVGKTKIDDSKFAVSKSIKERLELVKGLFKK